MIDLLLRIATRARWLSLATSRGLIDANGVPSPGVHIDEIGNVPLAPPVINPDGTVTHSTLDTWWMVNLRLHGQMFLADQDAPLPGEEAQTFKFFRSKLAHFIRENSTQTTVRGMRVYQFGTGDNRVQIFDPRDVTQPWRVWVGGLEL